MDARNNVRQTPLHMAMYKSHNEAVIDFLISKGADIEARDRWGSTPLLTGSGISFSGGPERLILRGANVNAQSNDGITPLHRAAGAEKVELAKLLISRGVDINARTGGKTGNEETPLLFAARNGNEALIELLISHGADINIRGLDGKSPLFWAVEYQRKGRSSAAADLLRRYVKMLWMGG